MMRRLIRSLGDLGLCFLKRLPKQHRDRRELSRRDPIALFIQECLHARDSEVLSALRRASGLAASRQRRRRAEDLPLAIVLEARSFRSDEIAPFRACRMAMSESAAPEGRAVQAGLPSESPQAGTTEFHPSFSSVSGAVGGGTRSMERVGEGREALPDGPAPAAGKGGVA